MVPSIVPLIACDCANGWATLNATRSAATQNPADRNMKQPPCSTNPIDYGPLRWSIVRRRELLKRFGGGSNGVTAATVWNGLHSQHFAIEVFVLRDDEVATESLADRSASRA